MIRKKEVTNWWLFALSSVAILAGFILTIISWLNLCTEECGAAHLYRLYGLTFETFGFIFFPILIFFHSLSRLYFPFRFAAGLLLGGAAGAEVFFIWLQYGLIGHGCPVCLSIASTIFLAGGCYFLDDVVGKQKERKAMLNMRQSLLLTLFIGFFLAFFGASKVNPLQAMENSLKESIAFGNRHSPIEVYLFTDWFCPACRQLEPKVAKFIPSVGRVAKITFVDMDIHSNSLNFSPYNLSFMIYEKPYYIKLRGILTKLSVKTTSPTEKEVQAAISSLGVQYKPLSFAKVESGIKYFKRLAQQYNIDEVPTMVIVNTSTKQHKTLYGGKEMNEKNIFDTINQLK